MAGRHYLLYLLLVFPPVLPAGSAADMVGDAWQRHFTAPRGYEKLQIVMTDRNGDRTLRQMRRYWRAEGHAHARQLLVIDYPPELRGVALLAEQRPTDLQIKLFLPAYGRQLFQPVGEGGLRLPGTDLLLSDLIPESPQQFSYELAPDRVFRNATYRVVKAYPRAVVDPPHAWHVHYLRKQHLFPERTDYFAEDGSLLRRRMYLDLKPTAGAAWQAGKWLVEDRKARHSTLVIVEERAYSDNYVPAELFEPKTLFAGRHLQAPELWLKSSDGHGDGAGK